MMWQRKSPKELPTEAKILIVNGQTLINETRNQTKGKGLDMTSRLQLRDDCDAVEKCIKKLQRNKWQPIDIEKLRLAIIRLQTTSGEILHRREKEG